MKIYAGGVLIVFCLAVHPSYALAPKVQTDRVHTQHGTEGGAGKIVGDEPDDTGHGDRDLEGYR